ncbi:MAG: disulfide bond formation protein B [Rhodoferax sp.]|uniref:disulfide bond formation protein B n=1 Tax=Rhodoferax sp. TaxID=50421 RepID=UPI0026316F19|nr:disulfide bond formation protein B [Rhodoferax sp.]MDD2880357.1 disulfide bond formation protein B [Rhodoferax sp.]
MQRGSWLLLAALALALDGVALYLQHVLKVEPCNECIYVRVGVLCIGLSGLLGALAPKYLAVRLVALAAWLAALGWSLSRIYLLLDLERVVREGGEASCKRFKGFPDWMPLDTWLPNVFEPRAMCGTVSWTFLGHSVTFWIGVALSGLALAAVLALLAQPFAAKKRP